MVATAGKKVPLSLNDRAKCLKCGCYLIFYLNSKDLVEFRWTILTSISEKKDHTFSYRNVKRTFCSRRFVSDSLITVYLQEPGITLEI